jgi:hypothetical protein
VNSAHFSFLHIHFESPFLLFSFHRTCLLFFTELSIFYEYLLKLDQTRRLVMSGEPFLALTLTIDGLKQEIKYFCFFLSEGNSTWDLFFRMHIFIDVRTYFPVLTKLLNIFQLNFSKIGIISFLD